MLLIWPLIMAVLFKKLSPDRALIWSFLGAFMLLPTGAYFDLPLIPTLDKYTLPSVAALVLSLTMVKQKIRFFPESKVASVLMIGYVSSPLFSVLSNPEPVFWGVRVLPGLTIYDALSEVMKHGIALIPFILSFNLLATRKARHAFLTIYMLAGLFYSIPMLAEIRLSPQLNYWIYGMFPELFGQQIRFGGFRPVVFMGHGLVTAFFMLMAVMSAATLWRGSNPDEPFPYPAAFAWLALILILCKTVGVVLFAVLFVPIILFAGTRTKGWAIMFCATFLISYPVLRSVDAVPVDEMVDYAAIIQAERAQSLEFRFDNEKILLDHAARKPVFGWGYWGRNRLYDLETGQSTVTTDGHWIIVIGMLGWTGYICVFGLLTLPLFRLWFLRKRWPADREVHIIYGIALMLGVNLIDLIPNSTINHLTWTLAGLLLASSTVAARAEFETAADPSESDIKASLETPPAAALHQRHVRKPRSTERKAPVGRTTRTKR